MKTCCGCRLNKPLEQFSWKNKKLGTRQARCVPCYRQYMRFYYRTNEKSREKQKSRSIVQGKKRRETDAQALRLIKSSQGCLLCKENSPECLDYHHPNDDKEDNVAYLLRHSGLKKALLEASKCVLVCANCHRKIHSGRIILSK